MSAFQDIDQSDPNCVIVGDAGSEFTYNNMNTALNVLLRSKDPVLIALGMG